MHIITGLGTGGAETMLFRVLSGMNRSRYEHSVVSLTDEGVLGKRIKDLNIPLHELRMPRGKPTLRGIRLLRSITEEFKPNVIQAWMYHANVLSVLCNLFMKNRIPICWNVRHSLHDYIHERPSTRATIRLNAILSRFATAIVYNSRVSCEQHSRFGLHGKCSIVIPNGFDIDSFAPDPEKKTRMRRQLGIKVGSIVVGMIGRYHPLKDHKTFFQAAMKVARKNKTTVYLCAGSGLTNSNPELQRYTSEAILQDRIMLLGERQDIPDITATLDIAVLSSVSESFPNVIGEAMACEIPCVVTDVGDARYIVGDSGIVVPSRDSKALAEGILSLIEKSPEELRIMGKRARSIVIDNFSIEKTVRKYEALYSGFTGEQEQ